ncbi:MAG: hypothetical protein Q4D54_00680 [Eubacteriales bacterium]|nr:hypothetical protein [Eubacteriales bacterium]
MKKMIRVACILVLMLVCTACEKSEKRTPGQSNAVADVLESQIEAEDKKTEATTEVTSEAATEAAIVTTTETVAPPADVVLPDSEEGRDTPGVDYDLTQMNSNMVLSTVTQFMYYPDDYIGKIVRAEGLYYPIQADNGNIYHYVVIQDATACCAQGLEFVWKDDSHVYPDEYPPEESVIVVTGEFETYFENGDYNTMYCHLKNADLVVK